MTSQYTKRATIILPIAYQDKANQLMADITGNPADALSFNSILLSDDGVNITHCCMDTPLTDAYLQKLLDALSIDVKSSGLEAKGASAEAKNLGSQVVSKDAYCTDRLDKKGKVKPAKDVLLSNTAKEITKVEKPMDMWSPLTRIEPEDI